MKDESPIIDGWEAGWDLSRLIDSVRQLEVRLDHFPRSQRVVHSARMELTYEFNTLWGQKRGLTDWETCPCGVCLVYRKFHKKNQKKKRKTK